MKGSTAAGIAATTAAGLPGPAGIAAPTVEVLSFGIDSHAAVVLSGLATLGRGGEIDLRWRHPRWRLRPCRGLAGVRPTHVAALVDGEFVYFDLHDSGALDACVLDRPASYFKRSFDPAICAPYPNVHPLGLYHEIVGPDLTWFELTRAWHATGALRGRLSALAYATATALNLSPARWFRPTPERMRHPPAVRGEPTALFMFRVWDPDEVEGAEAEERERLNESRVACLRALRESLGPRLVGGVQHTPYALRRYPDDLLGDRDSGRKSRYVAAVRRAAVCVATTGLHRSIGGKFAEYVAFSRAIVSEPLAYVADPELLEGAHYVVFTTPEECVRQTRALLDDPLRLRRMMLANYAYYHARLRPDAMVRHALLRVYERSLPAPATVPLSAAGPGRQKVA